MVLYFIRHGQSSNNSLYANTGDNAGRSDDPELTEKGALQASRVAEHLHAEEESYPYDGTGYRITHVYASPMVRALGTGLAVAEKLGLELYCKRNYHETGGIYLDDQERDQPIGQPGKTGAELKNRFPRVNFTEIEDDQGWWNRPYEDRSERPIRGKAILTDLLTLHSGTADRVAIITHGGIFNYIIRELMQSSDENLSWVAMCNCGISRIDEFVDKKTGEKKLGIGYCNSIAHLPPEMRT